MALRLCLGVLGAWLPGEAGGGSQGVSVGLRQPRGAHQRPRSARYPCHARHRSAQLGRVQTGWQLLSFSGIFGSETSRMNLFVSQPVTDVLFTILAFWTKKQNMYIYIFVFASSITAFTANLVILFLYLSDKLPL